ncbi:MULTISPECIES: heavy metal translocating P-type ATPase [Clostridium]|uniref:Cadmium, zinc and cobalt-transporting ATPase n=2 Tax=Clostridium TaxID=1485 RepID=A0A151AMM2_9CLOT|nr:MULTISPECIES: heavy metal translocating P-type ATPase [Clostridium]KYH28879.1 cadmium, zinc and cobalt-transporting ATPase [Clostridium colicanis DSM 13634]MBE6043287.1 cadmium-translocating P-type ATPase [Clostridium thermopalmarium]PRR73709.1 Cadmium, zinc and cobalt-transporting ATPase [Clostridium thermopalmarium DSM 5974]PVZ21023.1 Cd2+/Zn2+-exporting ATPase [Clostridium thermopalmarium DSM 5974]
MSNRTKKEFILDGLCCANCAAKIERGINDINGVKNVSLNFMSKKLTIEINEKDDLNRVMEEAADIVKRIEPDVKMIAHQNDKNTHSHEHHHDHSHGDDSKDNKGELLKLAIGAALFLGAVTLNLSYNIELALFIISYILVGGEIVLRALKNVIRGQVFDENFLMSLATLGAFAIGEFPEGVSVMLFYQVGELFQDIAVNRSRKSISELMNIRPDYANLKVGNNTKIVSPEEVKVGDIIVVKPGEKVPLDGKIIEGKSMLDTSALTGESVPREVKEDDEVLSGFINKNGLLTIKVEKAFGESTVARILNLVENASSKKAPTENFITKFARYYTPAVVITALALAIIPPIVLSQATFSQWLYRALVFLVVSCPCALVVSIPLGFFGGIGGASKKGILIKGGNYLEALNDVETIVFDKTGTLTKGVFKVTDINAKSDIAKRELLKYAAFAEAYSNHPIAISIMKEYGNEIDKEKIEDYNEISGHGTKIRLKDGKNLLVGNDKLMIKENITFDKVEAAGTVVYVAVDKEYVGYIVISDEIKEDSKQAINALKDIGIKKTIMLTGDSNLVGEKVAKDLGLDEAYTELLPDQKVDKLEEIDKEKSPKGKIVFVGDGINDAPVLARADIGIAMGGLGSDAAIEAADVVIMTDEPSKIASAIKIAKRTKGIIYQNIVFALGIKALVLILGAFGLATMWEAVFADVGVAVIAVLNAMRALKVED